MKAFLAAGFLLILLSCHKTEEPVIQPDIPRFFQVYLTFIELSQSDSTGLLDKRILMDSALAIHNMEPTQFDTTLSYLEKNPEIFLQAFEQFDDSLRSKMQIRQ